MLRQFRIEHSGGIDHVVNRDAPRDLGFQDEVDRMPYLPANRIRLIWRRESESFGMDASVAVERWL